MTIQAPKAAVWDVVTDFENAADRISAIEELEVLERPESGLEGFKWKESRTMFGKTAEETMWITEAVENSHYKTRAESHGCIYRSTISVAGEGESTVLKMDFSGEATSFMGKIMSGLMGWVFKGSMRKAMLQDLTDLKGVIEKSGGD